MALRYYDDILIAKLKKWMPTDSNLRVLGPDETKRLFETQADDKRDARIQLPCIALSRDNDLHLNMNIKNSRSFDGHTVEKTPSGTKQLNIIPVTVMYQLDIYTKTAREADEYVREYLFKLINHPSMKIVIPYNTGEGDVDLVHTANIRVGDTVSDTSAISERLFAGQFYRWTFQLELQDAFLFSVPYRRNWRLYIDEDDLLPDDEKSILEMTSDLNVAPEKDNIELMNFNLQPVVSTNK